MNDIPEPPPAYKAILRKLVPNALVKERGIYIRLGPKAGGEYVRLKLLDTLGVKGGRDEVPKTCRSFAFVCFGNIMRSPMAEALLKRELKHLKRETDARIVSAGLHATAGNPAHPRALAASGEFGVSLQNHRAQILTAEMVRDADAIFAMDFQNKAELLAMYPDARKKIFMLSAYLTGPERFREIPDPYFGDLETTRNCYRTLETCIRNLAADIFPPE